MYMYRYCTTAILSLYKFISLLSLYRETTPWYFHAFRIMAVFACIAGTANDSKYRTMSNLNTCMSSDTGEIYGSTLHLDHATLCLEKHSSQDCVCVMHESVYCSTHNLNNSNNCGVFLNIIPTLLLASMISCVGLLLLTILQSCCLRRKITRTTSRFVPRRIPLWEIAVSSVSFESNSDDQGSSSNHSDEHQDTNNNTTSTTNANITMDNIRRSRYAYTLANVASSKKTTTSTTGTGTITATSTTITATPSRYTEQKEDSNHNTTIDNNNNTTDDTTIDATTAMEEGRLPEDLELGVQYPTQPMSVATAIPIQPSSKPVFVRAFPLATFDI